MELFCCAEHQTHPGLEWRQQICLEWFGRHRILLCWDRIVWFLWRVRLRGWSAVTVRPWWLLKVIWNGSKRENSSLVIEHWKKARKTKHGRQDWKFFPCEHSKNSSSLRQKAQSDQWQIFAVDFDQLIDFILRSLRQKKKKRNKSLTWKNIWLCCDIDFSRESLKKHRQATMMRTRRKASAISTPQISSSNPTIPTSATRRTFKVFNNFFPLLHNFSFLLLRSFAPTNTQLFDNDEKKKSNFDEKQTEEAWAGSNRKIPFSPLASRLGSAEVLR